MEQGINATLRFPPEVLKLIADVGLDVALDLTYDATKKYSGDYFFQEMQGLADAAGVPVKTIRRIHMIGELTKGSCSMVGAWGKATAGGETLQVRALDWDVQGPFKDYPQLTVYGPLVSASRAIRIGALRAVLCGVVRRVLCGVRPDISAKTGTLPCAAACEAARALTAVGTGQVPRRPRG